MGVALPTKKDAAKSMVRGDMKATYDDEICLTVWRDSQPVYIASNFCGLEPVGTCRRYGGKEKGYLEVPCPFIVQNYNKSMGGVDLVNQTDKAYRISTRLKKWYWALYTWFLNVMMVQAWRLFRSTARIRHQKAMQLQQDTEDEETEEEFEERMEGRPAIEIIQRRRVRRDRQRENENETRRQRKEEKKLEEMPQLEFVRQVVEVMLDRHSDVNKDIPARQSAARMSVSSSEALQHDHTRAHFIIKSTILGRCKHCHNRSYYRALI